MSPNTKPIPRGTHNLSVNVPVSDAIETHRRAGRFGLSMGAYIRRCIAMARFTAAALRVASKAGSYDKQALALWKPSLLTDMSARTSFLGCARPLRWSARRLTSMTPPQSWL